MGDQRCVLCVQHHQPGVDCHDRSNMATPQSFRIRRVPLLICRFAMAHLIDWGKVRSRVRLRSIQRSNRVTICSIVRSGIWLAEIWAPQNLTGTKFSYVRAIEGTLQLCWYEWLAKRRWTDHVTLISILPVCTTIQMVTDDHLQINKFTFCTREVFLRDRGVLSQEGVVLGPES